ncbi:MAG: NADH-quinone oxidoreductase subunit A [Bdellovibrio sp.]|nr:NADH-quinone oxidoreductase subunit A [Bdellovibrio sp.]
MQYVPIFILMLIGFIIGCAILVLSYLLGPKTNSLRKNQPFECGMPALGNAKQRFSVRFYLIALLFLLFDVEAVFFFPWAVVYREYLSINAFILYEMVFFIAILFLGYFYVLKKGALEWD